MIWTVQRFSVRGNVNQILKERDKHKFTNQQGVRRDFLT